MNTRIAAAISAMVIILTMGWLILSPTANGTTAASDPLRAVLSVLLIFGIATLAATLALLVHHRETH